MFSNGHSVDLLPARRCARSPSSLRISLDDTSVQDFLDLVYDRHAPLPCNRGNLRAFRVDLELVQDWDTWDTGLVNAHCTKDKAMLNAMDLQLFFQDTHRSVPNRGRVQVLITFAEVGGGVNYLAKNHRQVKFWSSLGHASAGEDLLQLPPGGNYWGGVEAYGDKLVIRQPYINLWNQIGGGRVGGAVSIHAKQPALH